MWVVGGVDAVDVGEWMGGADQIVWERVDPVCGGGWGRHKQVGMHEF